MRRRIKFVVRTDAREVLRLLLEVYLFLFLHQLLPSLFINVTRVLFTLLILTGYRTRVIMNLVTKPAPSSSVVRACDQCTEGPGLDSRTQIFFFSPRSLHDILNNNPLFLLDGRCQLMKAFSSAGPCVTP